MARVSEIRSCIHLTLYINYTYLCMSPWGKSKTNYVAILSMYH